MFFLVTLLGRITQFFRTIGTTLTAPFRNLVYGFRSLARYNPLTQLGQAFKNVERQVRYYLGLPNQVTGVQPEPFRPRQAWRDWREGLSGGGSRRNRAKVAKQAQYSQIHLVAMDKSERVVLHIGTIIGRSEAEIVLNHTTPPTVLRFTQSDPEQYGAPMRLTYVAGKAALQVDGAKVEADAPIREGSHITVDKREYTCQLYAWDKTPIVTRVDAGWSTNVGPKREQNQDAIGLYQHEKAYLFVIADGVGGGEYGDLVSTFAVQYMLATFHKNVAYNLNWADVLKKAFQYINAEVRSFAQHSINAEGTTLTAVVVSGFQAYVAHVGDSRLYHWHGDFLRLVTTDHVRHQPADQNTRALNEGEVVQMRDVLSKAIGKADVLQFDAFTLPLQPGDKLLLCTDGITRAVEINDISQLVASRRAPWLAEQLVAKAIEAETEDNVSAIAIDVLTDPYVDDTWQAVGSDRVYVGYSRIWSLKLKAKQGTYTAHPIYKRGGCWATLVVILLVLFVVGVISRGQNSASTTPLAVTLDLPVGTLSAPVATAISQTETAAAGMLDGGGVPTLDLELLAAGDSGAMTAAVQAITMVAGTLTASGQDFSPLMTEAAATLNALGTPSPSAPLQTEEGSPAVIVTVQAGDGITPAPPPTLAVVPSRTPFPTAPLQPTVTLSPTPTPIPVTSTLRPSSGG